MVNPSFVSMIEKNNAFVYDIRTVQNGKNAFVIVKVAKAKHTIFKMKLGKEEFDMADYGEILHSGFGEPSDDIKSQMRKKYGMYGDT